MDLQAKSGTQFTPTILDRFTFARHFGLSSSNICDTFLSIITESWHEAVHKHLAGIIRASDDEEKERFLKALVRKIRLNGKLNVFLEQLTHHLFDYTLRIPSGVTLPSDMEQKEYPQDNKEISARIDKLREEVMKLNEEKRILVVERENYEKGVEVLQKLKNLQ
ncbi:hypothetical protein L596_014726 [Steinernema carpocapsae]|uniref:Protein MIS12 homolog n=1 Tax=Steinernema carpocapsae TaxID=34508 RepID=A0A4U5NDL7_STECR|nr:hypothetical protein L596_014726 [Steinernema carpocapsae]